MIRATAPTQDFQEPIRAIKAPWVIFELADMLACPFSSLSNFFLLLRDLFILIDLNFLLLKTIHIPPDYCMFPVPGPIGPHPKARSLSQARWPDTRQAGVPVGGLTLVQTESRQLTVNAALAWSGRKSPELLVGVPADGKRCNRSPKGRFSDNYNWLLVIILAKMNSLKLFILARIRSTIAHHLHEFVSRNKQNSERKKVNLWPNTYVWSNNLTWALKILQDRWLW